MMNILEISRLFNLLVAAVVLMPFCNCNADIAKTQKPEAKYVFLFIGDGMANAQVHVTEAYLAASQPKAKKLTMNTFPVHAMQISHSSSSLITDSAAAGTALACGQKTRNGVLAKSADLQQEYPTIAELAKARGMRVGIVSSVSLDHATPAAFYAHQNSRSSYEQIDFDLLNKNFDYFAGGGFRVTNWKSEEYKPLSRSQRNEVVRQTATAKGFRYIDSRKDFDEVRSGRVIAVNPILAGGYALPYTIDIQNDTGPGQKYEGTISLAEFTRKGIDLLDGPQGFFMMVEGGKIDWACHANDARTAIDETIAFDQAIAVALDFYNSHPDETLIVVTGDHECGGMTLGFAATKYSTSFNTLSKQTMGADRFNGTVIPAYTAGSEDIDSTMWQIIFDTFGLDGAKISDSESDDLSEYQMIMLENAFDKQFNDIKSQTAEQDYLLYGNYKPLAVTLTHIINHRAGLAWSSYSHTAIPVPVRVIGNGQHLFNGYYENIEIPRKIAEVLNVEMEVAPILSASQE